MYPHPIAFNALPEIDSFMDSGYTSEEWKVVSETRKILHLPDLPVCCTAVRVPVFTAHSEAVHVETEQRDPADTPAAVRGASRESRSVDDPQAHRYPLATHAAGSDAIYRRPDQDRRVTA